MIIHALKTGILKKKFDLVESLAMALKKNGAILKNSDVLVISSKVVALSQGRIIDLKKVRPSRRAKSFKRTRYGFSTEDPRIIELVLRESRAVLPGKMVLAATEGALLPAGGIDLSNAPKDHAILLPSRPWSEAEKLHKQLRARYKIKKIGIVICDSHCQPLRWGTTGIAIAWAGFLGVEDLRGKKDIFNNPLKFTKKATADDLASCAALVMGESDEKTPFALIRDAPVKFTLCRQKKNDIFVKPKDCIFAGTYNEKTLRILNTK